MNRTGNNGIIGIEDHITVGTVWEWASLKVPAVHEWT